MLKGSEQAPNSVESPFWVRARVGGGMGYLRTENSQVIPPPALGLGLGVGLGLMRLLHVHRDILPCEEKQ